METLDRSVARVSSAAKRVALANYAANIDKEKNATILKYGDQAYALDGGVLISILTDGSWQKRYGRCSLAGIGGMYGALTNLCHFPATRVARCWTCRSVSKRGVEAPADHDCTKTCGIVQESDWRRNELSATHSTPRD